MRKYFDISKGFFGGKCMVYFLRAKPNKSYYKMDKSSFAEGGVRRLQTPFLAKDSGKGVFCFKFFCTQRRKIVLNELGIARNARGEKFTAKDTKERFEGWHGQTPFVHACIAAHNSIKILEIWQTTVPRWRGRRGWKEESKNND